jgi:formate hydrogenlyase transcriptional activator
MSTGAVRVREFPARQISRFASPLAGSVWDGIVGCSDELRRVLCHVRKVASTDATVLITGESGTGKEMIARAIYENSRRASRPFIKVNCAAIAPSLIASELFGYEKGAFTGALQRRVGRFEAANGGTIFLDEIGDVPSEIQTALLRVLQEREFERVGSPHSVPVDVRVLAATNRNLDTAIDNGTFRQDLFYRLNVFPIHMPPLRDRFGDVPMLAQYFIHRFATSSEKKIDHIDLRTLACLDSYHWPGNIRELQNIIERAVILCEGDTLTIDEAWMRPRKVPRLTEALLRTQREVIEAALCESRGRLGGPWGAARKLGIPRTTLDSRIRGLRIDKRKFETEPAGKSET